MIGSTVFTFERGRDGLQFRLIFAFALPAHLFVGLGARLRPGHWRNTSHYPLLVEAWRASATTAQLAFAG